MDTVYLNGQYMAATEAKISVFDRGFLFADSVYEVIPYYSGVAFQLEEHLSRLNRSLAALNIKVNCCFTEIAEQLILKNGAGNRSVYIQVSRGAAAHRSHSIDPLLQPTVFACSQIIRNNYALDIDRVLPVKVIVCEDLRWRRCDIKSTSLLANILAIEQARLRGAQEALLQRQGIVLEGASSSLFIVEAGQIIAPRASTAVLNGTTSELIKRLAVEQSITLNIDEISYARLLAADEVWISSSTRGLLPVNQVDEQSIGGAHPGQMGRRLYQLLAENQAH